MKQLLNNWAGRFYLVVQFVCLAITITRCLNFIEADLNDESRELRDNQEWTYRLVQGVEAQQRELLTHNDATWKRHSEQRRNAIFLCIAINLAVPVIFGVGYFIINGFPKRKSGN